MCALGSYVGSLFKGGEIEDTNSEFVKTLTAANYEEVVLHSDKPVLIDFHALWCGPCRAMSPIVSTLAMEKADSLVIAKINVDQEAQLAQQFNVSSIPTFIVVNKGKVVARTEGAVGRRGLDKLLAEIENK